MQIQFVVGRVGLGTMLLGIVLSLYALVWNIHTQRYNDDDRIGH